MVHIWEGIRVPKTHVYGEGALQIERPMCMWNGGNTSAYV